MPGATNTISQEPGSPDAPGRVSLGYRSVKERRELLRTSASNASTSRSPVFRARSNRTRRRLPSADNVYFMRALDRSQASVVSELSAHQPAICNMSNWAGRSLVEPPQAVTVSTTAANRPLVVTVSTTLHSDCNDTRNLAPVPIANTFNAVFGLIAARAAGRTVQDRTVL